jgi:phage head maturation protease
MLYPVNIHIEEGLFMGVQTIRAPVTTAVKKMAPPGRIGGYLVVWGDRSKRDLQGEYFTADTELGLNWYPRRPVLYHHGLDGNLGPVMIGQIEIMQPDSTGLWVEAQLDMHSQWSRAVLELVDQGALGWSSGSLPHLVDVATDGYIRRWPIVEGSLTPTPAEPRYTDVVAVKAAFTALGLSTDLIEGGIMNDPMEAIKRLPASQSAPNPHNPVIEVRSKYADLSPVDMAHTLDTLVLLSISEQTIPALPFIRRFRHAGDLGILNHKTFGAHELM